MHRTFAFLLLCFVLTLPAASAAEKTSRWRAIWQASQAMLLAGDAADAASSWGKVEGNPLVRSGQRFSYGSLAIKLAAVTGGMVAQHYIVHKDPEKARLFATTNLIGAGIFGVVAEHNMHVPRP